jgi:hypothetical protein
MRNGATGTKVRFVRKEINPQRSRASSGDKQCAVELQSPRNESQGRKKPSEKAGQAPEPSNAQRNYKHKSTDQKESKETFREGGPGSGAWQCAAELQAQRDGSTGKPRNLQRRRARLRRLAMHSGATSTKRRFTRKEINPQNSRASSGDKQCAVELQSPRNESQGRKKPSEKAGQAPEPGNAQRSYRHKGTDPTPTIFCLSLSRYIHK